MMEYSLQPGAFKQRSTRLVRGHRGRTQRQTLTGSGEGGKEEAPLESRGNGRSGLSTAPLPVPTAWIPCF